MDVPPSGALNLSESPHLIISYLLKDERKDWNSKFNNLISNMKG